MGDKLRKLALIGAGALIGYMTHAIKSETYPNENAAVVYANPTPNGQMKIGVQQITSFGRNLWEREVILDKNPNTEVSAYMKYQLSEI